MCAAHATPGFSLDNLPVVGFEGSNSSDDGSASSSSSDAHTASSISSTRSLGSKRYKRVLLCAEASDTNEELLEELERSKSTQDCNLSALQLTAAPQNIPLEVLTKLSLSENQLTTLPSSMFTGKNGHLLRELDINSNELTSLPESLFYLPALEVLMLNHNQLTKLPFDNLSRKRFLPALRRVGLEFNNIQRFPVEFFELCPALSEVLLGQNESMLDAPVPFDRLKHHAAGSAVSVLLKVDNRPRFIQQIQREQWTRTLPWLTLDMHKIYPDKVLDFLFLGSMRTAQTVTVYHDLDIGFVLTVGRDLEVKVEPGMKHLVLPINDFPEENMSVLFAKAFGFINEARACKKGVLIHCFAGLSRSVTIAAAYIMKYEKMTRDEAMTLIKAARPAARPNVGFMEELLRYEQVLRVGGVLDH